MTPKKSHKAFLIGSVLFFSMCIACFFLWKYNPLEQKKSTLTYTYLVKNGFLSQEETAIDYYNQIFILLKKTEADIESAANEHVNTSDADLKKELYNLLIDGAKCKELGVKEPGYLESFTSYKSPVDKLLKLDDFLLPYLKDEDVSQEIILAFMAFGQQLCDYKDVILNGMGIRCKYKALGILKDKFPQNTENYQILYSEMIEETKEEFRVVKERARPD